MGLSKRVPRRVRFPRHAAACTGRAGASAAAILLPLLLLVMDALGLQQLWPGRDRELLKLLLPAGLFGTVLGTVLFGLLRRRRWPAVVGGLTLLFLAQRLLMPRASRTRPPPSRTLGRLLPRRRFTTCRTRRSAPINAYVLPLRLSPASYAATMAVFFAALNLSKVIPYAWLGLIDVRNFGTALLLMPLAPSGRVVGYLADPTHCGALVLPTGVRRHVLHRGRLDVTSWQAASRIRRGVRALSRGEAVFWFFDVGFNADGLDRWLARAHGVV